MLLGVLSKDGTELVNRLWDRRDSVYFESIRTGEIREVVPVEKATQRLLARKGSNYITDEIAAQKAALRGTDIEINCCEGCFYGVKRKPREILNRKYIGIMYRAFQSSGWLR